MTQSIALPPWAESLKVQYLSGEASMFLLHGNVRDLFPSVPAQMSKNAAEEYLPLRLFLEQFLGRSKEIVLYYNVSEGIQFPTPKIAKRFQVVVNARRALRGEPPLAGLPRSPAEILPIIEDLITDPNQRAAIILDFVEMVVPMGDLSFMGDDDKSNLVTLQRWSAHPSLLESDNLVLMVSENPADVHRRVVSSSQLAMVELELPDLGARRAWIEGLSRDGIKQEMEDEALAKVTAGLSLVQIRGIFRRAKQSGDAITFRTVSRRKKAIIEQECQGLVEFVDPSHDFRHVGGMEGIKKDLMRVASSIKKGHTNRVPMGIIFVGPMGTGKTFIAEAFAAESGLTCLKFKNFREKWVGSTEGNLEKILQVVNGLGYVLLIIDEADRSMSAGADGDGGTSSRVIARLKEFMSDTSHRGRVVILMMTNRPDKLDVDLKRPGRFDMKIPFFFPEEASERLAVLQALVRKNKLEIAQGTDLQSVADNSEGYSGAELESVLISAAGQAADVDRRQVQSSDLEMALQDVVPSRDSRMLAFMEMLAVFESSSRRMLPERYQSLSAEEVNTRLDALRASLGRRL